MTSSNSSASMRSRMVWAPFDRCSNPYKRLLIKPAAAIGDPPRNVADRDGRGERPPEWKQEIRKQSEHREGEPEDLALHIVDCKSFRLLTIRNERCEKTFVSR